MPTPILHHYPASPFSEKIRLILGLKKLSWTSVIIPAVMPKPDVVALTGGYRKTPLLQIGCDVYCDTRLIARVIESLAPDPSIYPRGDLATAAFVAQWADQTLFFTAVPYAFQPESMLRMASLLKPEEAMRFVEDRTAMAEGARVRSPHRTVAFAHMPVYLGLLEEQLSDRAYFVGDTPSIADFSLYHPLWFVERGSPSLFERYPAVAEWMRRMASLGHGTSTEISSQEAIDLCHESQPRELPAGFERDPNGIVPGTPVTVRASDIARDPIEGELVFVANDEIAISRVDPRAGEVIVHFPRIGYELMPRQSS